MKKLKIGPMISILLKKQGQTQLEMAENVGMSPAQICNFLNGKSDIRASLFVEILNALGIDLVKLVRLEAGIEIAGIEDVSQQLSLLPQPEKNTLTEFLKAYQSRLKKDSLSA